MAVLAPWSGNVIAQHPPSVAKSQQSLVTLAGINVSLAAAEPEVVDPVAVRFDHLGRMWVVEMRDYPNGPAEGDGFDGRIKILTDPDGDGLFDRSHTFVDGLAFPTGLQPWRDGVIVTLAGKIEFMADRDGDHVCDTRETWFQGFELGNEQLRANHPTLGPDGLVYIANGLRGGSVLSVHSNWDQSQSPVDLRGKDFVFDPNGGFFGAVAGNSQFGLSIDDFGNRVGCSNRNPGFETLFTLDDLRRDRWSGPADAMHDIAAPGPGSEVRAIADAWTTSHTHAGQFSAACGVTVGLGTAMPSGWKEHLVVCEPTSYAVQIQKVRRDGVRRDGIGRTSQRIDGDAELLASRDTWFRPVDTAVGPDGSLYVVDMCRAVIEHPDWAPKELQNRKDERWGDGCGRIWRIADSKTSLAVAASPSPAPTTDMLIDWLFHPNPWQRATATHRLLFDQNDGRVQRIRKRIRQPDRSSSVGLARAAGWLSATKQLDPHTLSAISTHSDPELRRLAIRLVRKHLDQVDLSLPVERLLDDEDPWVQFDAIALAGDLVGKEDNLQRREKLENKLAIRLAQLATQSSLSKHAVRRFACLPPTLAGKTALEMLPQQTSAGEPPIRAELIFAAVRTAALHDAINGRSYRSAEESFSIDAIDSDALLGFAAGWCEGHRSAGRNPVKMSKRLAGDPITKLLEQSLTLAKVTLSKVDESTGATALHSMTILEGFSAPCGAIYLSLLQTSTDDQIRGRALSHLLKVNDRATYQWLEQNVVAISADLRNRAIDRMSRSAETANRLLDWMQDDTLPTTLVSIEQGERLQGSKNPDVARRAKAIIGSARADRKAVIADYRPLLDDVADLKRGRKLFVQHCASCHQIDGVGVVIGPDISDSRTKTPEALLAAILDPNAAIDAGFLKYQVLTVDGIILSGALIENSDQIVAIKVAGGETKLIDQDEIEQFKATGVSLMPEGLERSIPPDAMKDLIGYLKGWRYFKDGSPTLDLSTL